MRVLSRVALVVVLLLGSGSAVLANHLQGDCPLTLVAQNPPATSFELSPHGAFRNGNLVHVLRGQVLTTYTVNDIGDLVIAREDFIGSMGAREDDGAAAFSNGYMFLSSEAGLEIYDLRNVRAGGNAPILVSRTANLHYRRLAINGNTLAGLYPIDDYPCAPRNTSSCTNTIDIWNIAALTLPNRIAQIRTVSNNVSPAFYDIVWSGGFLVAASTDGLVTYNMSNPSTPQQAQLFPINVNATWLTSTGSNVFGAGNHVSLHMFTISSVGAMSRFSILNAALALTLDRDNEIAFHRQAYIDEMNGRVVTMIDEIDPMTGDPARTIAFDVFDITMPGFEGSADRPYENVSLTEDDEVKWNPIVVGPYIYTVGELTGLQSYGGCGVVTGKIELDSVFHLTCGGSEIHGWVTGTQKIANVELFLDNGALGAATISGPTRTDISSRTPVQNWRISVNLDSITRGEHVLRAVGTDSLGNRRQFASQRLFFPGPGSNCTTRIRSVRR
jgi:hypothetical protein